MNKKIYNNLSIDNLRKTEWFNQFNLNEKEEINWGLEDNLDVSIYAKKEFDEYQMREIRLGLLNKVDVLIYANQEFDEEQMKAIREKLENEQKNIQ